MAFTYALVGSWDVQWNPEQTHDFILPDPHSHGPQCSLDIGVVDSLTVFFYFGGAKMM
jgi:hypothetical protein